MAKRRLRKKISSLETQPDSNYRNKTQPLECLSSREETLLLQVMEEELDGMKIGPAEVSQAQTNGLVITFLENLHEDLKEESRKFEIMFAGRRCRPSEATFGSNSRYGSRKIGNYSNSRDSRYQSSKKPITIQPIFDKLSDAISHMKFVNRQARDEMKKLKEDQRIFRHKKMPVQDEGEKEKMNEELLKLRMKLDITQKTANELKQKLQDINQKRYDEYSPQPTQPLTTASRCEERVNGCNSQSDCTATISSSISTEQSIDGKTSHVQVPRGEEERCLRIRQLELQLKRMEYRATNAEYCCEQLKRELNQKIIGYRVTTAAS